MKSYLAVLFIGILSNTYVKAASRVSGGANAPLEKFPYVALLRDHMGYLCGASVIHKNHLLTAAHCVYKLSSPTSLEIVVGTNNFTGEGGDLYHAKKIVVHKDHRRVEGQYSVNDVAIIEVSEDIKFNDRVQPVKLPSASAVKVPANTTVVLSGFGFTQINAPKNPEILQFAENKIEDHTHCALTWLSLRFIILDKSQICTKAPRGLGACTGDSGSPLVTKDGVQVGIVSFGFPCGLGYPDVYTNVAYHANWINEILARS